VVQGRATHGQVAVVEEQLAAGGGAHPVAAQGESIRVEVVRITPSR
jgi:hypothetical protein